MADKDEVDRLARECREDASRINAEFWRVNVGDYARRCTRPLCLSAGSGWSAEISVGELAALARVIANLPAIAGRLESARAEIGELKLAICRRDADHNEEVGMLRAKIEELRAMLPNWSHAEALQQRDALIAAGVAAQAELRSLRAELEGRLARLESTHDLTAGMLTGAGRRIAELEAAVARMAPVVAAADAWLEDPCKGLGSHSERDLEAAVRAYRATAPAPGS